MTQPGDIQWDRRLHIVTAGRDYSRLDAHNFGYDPTPYTVLAKLASSGVVARTDTFIDYGCGKGRVPIFMSNALGCKAKGIDNNEEFIVDAYGNLETYMVVHGTEIMDNVEFIYSDATEYEITDGSCFYFYNPFSCDVLCSVVDRIIDYAPTDDRITKIITFQPPETSREALDSDRRLKLVKMIDCRNLFMRSAEYHKIRVYEVV